MRSDMKKDRGKPRRSASWEKRIQQRKDRDGCRRCEELGHWKDECPYPEEVARAMRENHQKKVKSSMTSEHYKKGKAREVRKKEEAHFVLMAEDHGPKKKKCYGLMADRLMMGNEHNYVDLQFLADEMGLKKIGKKHELITRLITKMPGEYLESIRNKDNMKSYEGKVWRSENVVQGRDGRVGGASICMTQGCARWCPNPEDPFCSEHCRLSQGLDHDIHCTIKTT